MSARESSDDLPPAASQRWNRDASLTDPDSLEKRRSSEAPSGLSDEAKALLQKRAERAAQQATTARFSVKRSDEGVEQTTPVAPVEAANDVEDAQVIEVDPVIDLRTPVVDDLDNETNDELAEAVMMATPSEEPKRFVVSKLGEPLPDLTPPPPPPRNPPGSDGPSGGDGASGSDPGPTRPMSKFSPDEPDPDPAIQARDEDDLDIAADDALGDDEVGEAGADIFETESAVDADSADTIAADTTAADTTFSESATASPGSIDGVIDAESALATVQVQKPAELVPLQHAVLPALVENEPESNWTSAALLIMAAALAVLSGILGLLWLQERSESSTLRDQVAQAEAADSVTDQGLDELNREIQTLRLQNEQLQQERNDLSALVLELPAGRVTEIPMPFTPIFADEENGRLIAIGEGGEYITWGEGADGPITDSGSVSGTPTGLFAATRKAWVSTEAGRIDVLSLVAGEPGLPSVEFGPTAFMAAEDRGYWTFNSATAEVVRLKKSDGSITDAVGVPVPIIDLTIGAGSVWALGDDSRVYRINTADLTVQAIDAGEDLISVTATPDALWTLSAADGSLRRIDPVTGDVLVTVPVGRDPIDATFAGQAVWVALRAGSSLIEVDTRTSAVVSRTTLSGEPTALHQGDSGVFVTTTGDVPLVRVSSLTVATETDDAEADADAGDAATDDS